MAKDCENDLEKLYVLRERMNRIQSLLTNEEFTRKLVGGSGSGDGRNSSNSNNDNDENDYSESGRRKFDYDRSDANRAPRPNLSLGPHWLSLVFMTALLIITCTGSYAFFSLYRAIKKKFFVHHTEL